ncbi:MAG TPA: isoprenylcysteine carboxylmethyltransferase family protein [Vicinamibacterales bacterium]|nr:isoprenylcysteine carboxylmethyltransferase family protein [Vicinamibacterales bacterium]
MHIILGVPYHDTIATAVLALVILSWLVFAAVFLTHKRPSRRESVKKDRRSALGIVLQAVAFLLIWAIQRPMFAPIVPMPPAVETVVGALTVALAFGSVWLVMAAVRALGRQWAYTARVIEGHQLITEGPYGRVRNPIYAGMLGMLVATGLALTHWIGLLPALVVFAIGTRIRVRSEEALLRDTFGAEFDRYAARVPAVLPRLF